MNQITISTRDTDSEQRCIDDCNADATNADMECQHTYYAEIQDAENSMSDWEKLMYPERLEYLKERARNSRDECVKKIDKYKHTVVMTDQTIIPIEQISNIEGEMFEE